jgi:hypothetical protein
LTRKHTSKPQPAARLLFGAGLAIMHDDDGKPAFVGIVDVGSCTFRPERIDIIEYYSAGDSLGRPNLQSRGDVFFSDERTADFVLEALCEKLSRDARRRSKSTARAGAA